MAAYDAFISYSHAKDKPIAAALQSAVQKLGKPWYRQRALRVFRDDTSLSATPGLWPSIESALAQSRYLILLASPEAAASPWIAKEVTYWLDHKSADTLLIALTDGELGWDNAADDFVWRAGAPLPPALAGRFRSEPKWVDFRPYRAGAKTSDARFTELAADFAATIQGRPKEDLLSQEVRQQRRALALAWSAVGALVVLAAFAGWQWNVAVQNERVAIKQQEIARQQRDRAERALAVATETANSLVFDLAWELRDRAGMPRDLSRRILDHAQDLQRQLSDAGETTPALRRSEATALSNLALTLLALGDTTAALAAAERAGALVEGLIAIDPDNTIWQRDLSVNHNRIAETLEAAGQREEALAQYRRGHMLATKLVTLDPSNTLWQDDLSVSHGLIGRLLDAMGQREDALAEYRKSLAIIGTLAAGDPANTHWQRGLSVVHGHIGTILRATGRPEEAWAQFTSGLAISEKLVAADPSNTQWQRDLSVNYSRIGNVLETAGRSAEALATYRRALATHEKLVAGDSSNIEWQRDLSTIHGQIGNVLHVLGRREDALAEYRRSAAIDEKLAAADPGNTEWKRSLLLSRSKIGDVLAAIGRWEDAVMEYRRIIAIGEQLVAAKPSDAGLRRDLSVAYLKIGDILQAATRQNDALAEYYRSLAIAEELVAADPGNVDWQLDLVTGLYKVSTLLGPAKARPVLHRAIAALDSLAKTNKLTVAQADWPRLFRQALSALPPE